MTLSSSFFRVEAIGTPNPNVFGKAEGFGLEPIT